VDAKAAIDTRDPALRPAHRRLTILFRIVLAAFAIASVVALLDWPGLVYAVPLVLMLVGAVLLRIWWFRHYLRAPSSRAPAQFIVAAAALGAGLWCLGIASSWLGFLWALVPATLLGDCLAGRRKRYIALWVAALAAAAFGTGLALVPTGPGPAVWTAPAVGAFYIATMWTCSVDQVWWLRSLDNTRRTAAELATTRERLRLADDLHDILGHALEVVAFKSELAGRLLPAEAERARAEIDEVQHVAREAMSEVRALTHERRATNLAAELAGAQATLGSAGVELSVTGDPALVPEDAQDVLGRVLREAMTNLLRHAEATRCAVTLTHVAGTATLLVINDGVAVRDSCQAGMGTGLAGLDRYLSDRLGSFSAASGPDGTFTVNAELPVPA
jgi:two-component system sensor histidine kinase DesK